MPRKRRRRAGGRGAFRGAHGAGRAASAGMSQALRSLSSAQAELVAQRNQLDAQIQVLGQALKVMGAGGRAPARPAPAAGRPGGRGPRPGSLKSFILDVLRGGGVMAVKDITDGVRAAGYRTKNKTLAKSVGIALTELRGVKKVGRGKFRLK